MRGKIKDLLQSDNQDQQQMPSRQDNAHHAFADEDIKLKNTKAVKLSNENSIIKPSPPLPNIAQNAQKILSSNEEQKKIAFDLTTRLLGMIKDKTLDENKDPKSRDAEKQILSEYAAFSRLINSDPNQEDCIGTLTFVMSIARCMMIQRDRINECEYRVIQLNNKLARAEKRLEETTKPQDNNK